MKFPADFVWGVATAAYQVEGAAFEDGKGPSVWDMMCRREGAIWNGQNGEVAIDHYHRYQEDVALMAALGIQAYRFSISWPRVLPDGTGRPNPAGLAFYDRLVDVLLAANITPYITLFHWDYPFELYCRGGWLNPSSPDWFADYATLVVGQLGDRVSHWMTHNEPQCFIGLGLQDGRIAPGDRLGFGEVLRAAHHALLAHGKSVQAIRAACKLPSQVGVAFGTLNTIPATNTPEDIEAARQVMFSITKRNVLPNTWWFDPILLGHYPLDGLSLFGNAMPDIQPGEMETIRQPIDFIGLNMYQGETVRRGEAGLAEKVPFPMGHPMTAVKWFVSPEILHWGTRFFYERYRTPIMITESGSAEIDRVSLDGKVHDPQRIDYARRHLLELHKALEEGIPVGGYFHWTIMDNFEWVEGVKDRFGMIFVDYPTQKRIPKDSALWYQKVIASHGDYLDEDPY